MIFTCSCGASHERGPVDGVANYRCLRCGNITRMTRGQARVLEGHRKALHEALDAILDDIENRMMVCEDAGEPGLQAGAEGEVKLEGHYRRRDGRTGFAHSKIVPVTSAALSVTKGPDLKPTLWERVLKQPE